MKIDEGKLEVFGAAYRAGLRAAVEADAQRAPEERRYAFGPERAGEVADKMIRAMAAHPMSVSYDGDGFKRACKALGIKRTRKAIIEFLTTPAESGDGAEKESA